MCVFNVFVFVRRCVATRKGVTDSLTGQQNKLQNEFRLIAITILIHQKKKIPPP